MRCCGCDHHDVFFSLTVIVVVHQYLFITHTVGIVLD
jgi:hypothetical protein